MSRAFPTIKGQISAISQTVAVPTSDASSVAINIRGTFVGTLVFEASLDGENWSTVSTSSSLASAGSLVTQATAPGLWFGSAAAASQFRVRASAWTSGVADIMIKLSDDPMVVYAIPWGSSAAPAAAGTALMGDVGIQYRANATGAATSASVMSPAATTATNIKNGAGRVVGLMLTNTAAAVRSVKIFNVAAPTMGTTAAAFEIDLPANGTYMFNLEGGIAFSTAITWAVTSAKGLTDNTATGLAANDVTGAIFYV